ncbi:unnamed protein product, partial [Ectocarpus fasciculatus]
AAFATASTGATPAKSTSSARKGKHKVDDPEVSNSNTSIDHM